MAQARKSLKFGWLPACCGWFLRRHGRLAAASLLLVTLAVPGSAQRILFAGGQWAAIDFGMRCEARSRVLLPRRDTKPFAGFAFDRAGPRQGRFYVHLSRPARTGASVIATIGSSPFLLVGKGAWAWSRGGAQQSAMLEAARYGQSLRIETRDSRGSKVVDRYVLDGAATAIDAAAAACAGKGR